MRYLLFIATLWLSCSLCSAQTSDSLIVNQLRGKGIRFSHDNSVTLLMSGQEKFDDMFQAIRQAKHSVHLEYFNFRNDSIAGLLFDLLGEKVKEGVKEAFQLSGDMKRIILKGLVSRKKQLIPSLVSILQQ